MTALLLILACGQPEPPPSVETFRQLHEPVYGVYDLAREPDAVHGLLAAAFHGEALTREYVEHWSALARMTEEDVDVDVLGIEYLELLPLDGGRIDATWLVRGVVRHARHRHARVNRYRAIYTLADTSDGPRIVDTRLADLSRVRTALTLDDLLDPLEGSSAAEQGFLDPTELFEAGLLGTEEAETTLPEPLPEPPARR